MANAPKSIRVLVVDDSPLLRQVVKSILEAVPEVSSVETAPNGTLALRKIKQYDPHVVTMDVEMPGMDGLSVLSRIMTTAPRPVIMLSAYTYGGAHKTLTALELGAVDFIPKPSGRLARDLKTVEKELISKVLAVAETQVARRIRSSMSTLPPHPAEAGSRAPHKPFPSTPVHADVIAIGASTGGTEAIRTILADLPANFPTGIAVVQHMPEGFTKAFAGRLNELCEIQVKEAKHKDLIVPGRALIAPGHSHMIVQRGKEGLFVVLNKKPEVNGHRPSVDVLFRSVAKACTDASMGVLLTGMGRDGAAGLSYISEAGGFTIAQDKKSSVVYGMPKAAIELGAAQKVVSLGRIPATLARALPKHGKQKSEL